MVAIDLMELLREATRARANAALDQHTTINIPTDRIEHLADYGDVLVPAGMRLGCCVHAGCAAPIVYRLGERPACNACDPLKGARRVDAPVTPSTEREGVTP